MSEISQKLLINSKN